MQVNGATRTAGRLAVHSPSISERRRSSRPASDPPLKSVEASADVTIPLVEDGTALDNAFKDEFAAGVDVGIDYLWGPGAERLMLAGPGGICSIRRALRTSPSERSALIGSGIGGIPLTASSAPSASSCIRPATGGFEIRAKPVPLSEVEQAWPHDDSARRTVFTVNPPIY